MDRDETPIGGLASPLQPTKQLFYATLFMDALAVVLSLFVSAFFAVPYEYEAIYLSIQLTLLLDIVTFWYYHIIYIPEGFLYS